MCMSLGEGMALIAIPPAFIVVGLAVYLWREGPVSLPPSYWAPRPPCFEEGCILRSRAEAQADRNSTSYSHRGMH